MKDIKEFLHFYLGCDVLYKGGIYFLCGVTKPYRTNDKTLATFSVRPNKKGFRAISHSLENFNDIQPILRPLSDMTEEEKQIIENMSKIYRGERTLPSFEISKRWAADQTRYLLKQGFDLFGLIESGLAIDKSKLSTNER